MLKLGDHIFQDGNKYILSIGNGCEQCDLLRQKGCALSDIEAYRLCVSNTAYYFKKSVQILKLAE